MIVKEESVVPFDFDGLAIRDYTAGLQTGSSLAIITVQPGVSHAVSWSKRSDKYYYLIGGSVEFVDGDDTHAMSEGDFCLVPKGRRFSYRNNGKDLATLCLVHTPSFDLECEVFEEG